jgi:predicted phosphodiesterase
LNHYPELARQLAQCGEYDLVCYGHDHTFHVQRIGRCLLVNPGDLLGKDDRPSFALVHLAERRVQREYVGTQIDLLAPD